MLVLYLIETYYFFRNCVPVLPLSIENFCSGCILAELLTGYPLLPGEDEGDQLACMIELLGMPPQVI